MTSGIFVGVSVGPFGGLGVVEGPSVTGLLGAGGPGVVEGPPVAGLSGTGGGAGGATGKSYSCQVPGIRATGRSHVAVKYTPKPVATS